MKNLKTTSTTKKAINVVIVAIIAPLLQYQYLEHESFLKIYM